MTATITRILISVFLFEDGTPKIIQKDFDRTITLQAGDSLQATYSYDYPETEDKIRVTRLSFALSLIRDIEEILNRKSGKRLASIETAIQEFNDKSEEAFDDR